MNPPIVDLIGISNMDPTAYSFVLIGSIRPLLPLNLEACPLCEI